MKRERLEVSPHPPFFIDVYSSEAEPPGNIALIFSGQGSQYVGMGRELYKKYPQVRKIYRTADRVLGYPMSELSFQGPADILNQTEFAQPAIVVFNHASHAILKHERRTLSPRYYAGQSLGEINAFIAAGAFTFEDGLRLVKARAKGMQLATQENPGAMIVLMAKEKKDVSYEEQERILARLSASLTDEDGFGLFIEAENAETQVVVGGTLDAVLRAQEYLRPYREKGIVAIPFNVQGAFHCPMMEPARPYLVEVLDTIYIRRTNVPVIANTTAKPISAPEDIRLELIDQLTKPVLWKQTIAFLEQEGVVATIEPGGRGILSKMMQHRGTLALIGAAAAGVTAASILYLRHRKTKQ